MSVKLSNTKGEVFYGMHMYPGVAEYEEQGREAFRIFVNEDTIREMGPSFAGRPIFVQHVNEVNQSLNKLKNEADGWVSESFFNKADGKHWVKFIITSEEGLRAVKNGYRLSNAYIPKTFGEAGVWNGVSYQKQVMSAEYEHLALVQNPRYEESIIMSPEKFKAYNDEKTLELTRLTNSKEETTMKFWKREAVKNAADLEGVMVELPKSKVEIALTKLINDHDAILNMHGYANGDHLVKVGEKDEMSVNDLVKKHIAACNEIEELKKPKEENAADADDSDPAMENADDEDAEKKKKENADGEGEDAEKRAEDEEKKLKNEKDKAAAKVKAAALKNANTRVEFPTAKIDLPQDQVARGLNRYGSK